MTLDVLGIDGKGDPVPGATPSSDLDDPGFSATFSDLETHKQRSAPLARS